jgi:metallo-beta-lactamase family protein
MRATADLTRLVLIDAVPFSNGAFSDEDVNQLRFSCPDDQVEFQFGKFFHLAPDLTGAFIRTSHVLGSVSIELQFSDTSGGPRSSIVFSGVIGCNTDSNPYQMLLNARQYPSTYAEYIVCESTYGDRSREAKFCMFEQRMAALKELLLKALELGEGATIVLPAFSLQRTQELIVDLHCVLERWFTELEVREILAGVGGKATRLSNVLVDSPLASGYGEIFARELYRLRDNGKHLWLNPKIYSRLGIHRQQLELLLPALLCGKPLAVAPRNYTLQHGERTRPTYAAVSIIIAGAGMCNGGRVTGHMKRLLRTNKTIVALTGFQGLTTPGAELLKRALNPNAEIDGSFWDLSSATIKATVVNISPFYSGHADQSGLVDFVLHKNSPHVYESLKRVFLVHGEEQARQTLKREMEVRAAQQSDTDRRLLAVELPHFRSGWFDLVHNKWDNGRENPAGADISAEQPKTESVAVPLEVAGAA